MQETHGQARAIALIRRAPDGSDVGRVGLMFVRPPEFGAAKNVPPTSVHFLTTDDTAKLLKGPP